MWMTKVGGDSNLNFKEIKFVPGMMKQRFQNGGYLIYVLLICLVLPSIALADSLLPSGDTDRAYRIGAEDVLDISVWKEKELQREVVVRPDGGISFPFAGDVIAAGKTTSQLRAEITKAVQQFIPDALVTVSVKKVEGLRIYVIGKVQKSGQFVIGRYVDVLQALTLAGGLSPYASDKNIKVLRRINGKEVVYPFNYSVVKDGEKLEQNILLQNDDVVVVP